MKQKIRRVHWIIIFGEGAERWQMCDPGSNRANAADRSFRYGPPSDNPHGEAMILANIRESFDYLVNVCPTTKLACEKLAQLRAAVRALPEPEED